MDKCSEVESRSGVVGITVTYGNRYNLLVEVIRGMIDNELEKIIVVENGSTEESNKELKKLQIRLQGKLIVIWNGINLGSAGGFHAGLEAALKHTSCEYFWLLDDDNVPQSGAWDALNNVLINSNLERASHVALHSLRPDHVHRLNSSLRFEKTFPNHSSFFEFHIMDLPNRLLGMVIKKMKGKSNEIITEELRILPYASYGGLLLNYRTVKLIGLPDTKFFVYCDDMEYTYRLTRLGGEIKLVAGSKILDADVYWGQSAPGPGFFTRLLFSPSSRVYYTVRNHTYFDRYFWSNNVLLYKFNKNLFLTIIFLLAIYYRRFSQYKMIVDAVSAGERGLLGNDRRREIL